MRLSLLGVNHNTAPITLREKMAISAEKLGDSLAVLRSYVPHGVILSTCNRTEVYTIDGEDCHAGEDTLEFMKAWASVSGSSLLRHVYAIQDMAVAEHLFRVASSLESMVVGESEILGQVRQALDAAEQAAMVNLPLRRLFQSATQTGRRVRSETGISKNALSVSSVAVELATGIVGNLRRCKVLVIGAGTAGRLVAKVARERGASQIVVASRTKARAQALAAILPGTPIGLSDLAGELRGADIVVTCAGAPHRIVDVGRVEEAMKSRAQTPMVIIDIAVPRNVEPEVAQVKNVFLYNVDDLTEISNSNRKLRGVETQRAEEIIRGEVEDFVSWWSFLEVTPVLRALMGRAEEIRSAQLSRVLKRLPPLSADQREGLEAMTRSIVSRLLRDPVQYLKSNRDSQSVELASELFRLNVESGS